MAQRMYLLTSITVLKGAAEGTVNDLLNFFEAPNKTGHYHQMYATGRFIGKPGKYAPATDEAGQTIIRYIHEVWNGPEGWKTYNENERPRIKAHFAEAMSTRVNVDFTIVQDELVFDEVELGLPPA